MKKLLFILLMIVVTGCWVGCGNSSKKKETPKQPPVPVVVGLSVQKDMPLELKEIGTVEPYSTVSVISQASGSITKIFFREGQDVQKGVVLFQIDSRSYDLDLKQQEANFAKALAIVKQSEANLSRDIVQWNNAKLEVQRNQKLLEDGVVTQRDYDNARAAADALAATVSADKEIIQTNLESVQVAKEVIGNSKLQQSYTVIRAPISGRTGDLIVDVGNVIKANDRALVSINQLHPIYVSFNVPEQELASIKKHMNSGTLQMKARIGDDDQVETGQLTFIDNAVNRTTGTIRLKGTFENKSSRLWPGQFINIVLSLALQKNVIVVPSAAVATGQQGTYVYVVKPDKTVENRPVVVNRIVGAETILDSGVQAGEQVVTDGQVRILPNSKVEITKSVSGSK